LLYPAIHKANHIYLLFAGQGRIAPIHNNILSGQGLRNLLKSSRFKIPKTECRSSLLPLAMVKSSQLLVDGSPSGSLELLIISTSSEHLTVAIDGKIAKLIINPALLNAARLILESTAHSCASINLIICQT
jgi:hypothetical protein